MASPDVAESEVEQSTGFAPDEQAAQPFHFSNASALTSDRKESLESWHKVFLRNASGSVGDLLRLKLDLELDSVQIQTYGEMVKERTGDNQCILFRMEPQPGIWLLDMPVALAFMLVERMMGGPAELPSGEINDLTDLDQSVLQQFAESLLTDYARSWRPHAELHPQIVRQGRHLNYQLIHQPEELILRVSIRLAFKESKTDLHLIVPIMSVEDLLLRSLASTTGEEKKKEEKPLDGEKKSLMGSVPVPVSIRWQGFQMTLREVDELMPGDVLILDNRKCETAAVWLGDRPKFAGRIQREPQKATITITGPLE